VTPIPRWTGFTGKTFWDWLQLLVIPLALAAVAFGLNYFANERDQQREDRRAALERRIATDRRREDALGIYMQQMSDLMLQRKLLSSREGSEIQTVARTLTLTVLLRLDGRRKGFVLQFLSEGGLIPFLNARSLNSRVRLNGADLRGAIVRNLYRANLEGADLREADFRGANLGSVNLGSADLRRADFSGADIGFVNFQASDLRHANFSRSGIAATDSRARV
jgi:uncharacterized protein YjbI with pentapeptide repeats